MTLSFIIPVYNRPVEIDELLGSFLSLKKKPSAPDFEIIVVEDGSSITSESVVRKYSPMLPLVYLTQTNTGPSGARNHGAKEAKGEWLIFLDSDTLLPPGYLEAVSDGLQDSGVALFGGPDRGHKDFSPIQKGISFSMTSFLTTGGIRGGKKGGADKFYPRTFNLGITKSLFDKLGGFDRSMRYGEDLDLSMRAIESGAKSTLLSRAWLYHKRRTGYEDFFRQVMHSGEARWELEKKHPGTMKPVHFFPFFFLLFLLLSILVPGLYLPYPIYAALLYADALIEYRLSPKVSLHAVAASFVQHLGYGYGFLKGMLRQRGVRS